MTDKTECCVCLDKNICLNTKCSTCKKSICIDCYEKIAIYKFNVNKEKATFIMKCVICRKDNIKHYSNFKKKDIIRLADSVNKTDCGEIEFCIKEIQMLVHKYNDLSGYFEEAAKDTRFISSLQLYEDVFPDHKRIII